MRKLKWLAFFLFVYTLVVIVWGAWVRISHSGDGCGDSWPLCHGAVIPDAESGKTWVEYTHRLMSGVYGLLVLGLWAFILRLSPAGTSLRRWAHAALFFTLTEAALGAKLVLFGLVTGNDSIWRTLVMSLHQANSLLLTCSVTGLAVMAFRTDANHLILSKATPSLWSRHWKKVALIVGLICVTGAWASLAATLFPTQDLWEGLQRDFRPGEHHLIRLRILHPLLAVLGGGALAVFFWMKSFEEGPGRRVHLETAILILGGILFGFLTLIFLSPVWMKLTHLTLAHLIAAACVRWTLRPT